MKRKQNKREEINKKNEKKNKHKTKAERENESNKVIKGKIIQKTLEKTT
jgi:hypothetical protein